MEKSEKHFFASANSGLGFVSYFDKIFSVLEHHYIIKGGSGTGKSTFMKKVAEKAKSTGMSIEYFHCSSDPESLDGIIIKDLGIGVTDGTAPHIQDPKYPGAIDEIINVGDFWNKNELKKHREDIVEINSRKLSLFKEVYSYLGAAYNMENTMDRLSSAAVKYDKMDSVCNRITKLFSKKGRGKESIRLTEAITMNGKHRFDPYLNDAETVYAIRDKYGIAHIFLRKIYDEVCAIGKDRVISYSPLDQSKINMLYLPEENILFSVNPEYVNNEKTLNMDRFIDSEKYREMRNLIRYTSGCKNQIMNGAYKALEKIKELHFELESIYIEAMNFEKKDEYESKLIDEMFG